MNFFKPCVVIPVYNHADAVTILVTAIRAQNSTIRVIIVNDGSTNQCTKAMQKLHDHDVHIDLVEISENRGKGGAVKSGLAKAEAGGFSHAIQLDADGQHDFRDIPKFLALAKQYPELIIAGVPDFDENIPKLRYYARYLTHVWIWVNTLSFKIKDSMCGFRVYPVHETNRIISDCSIGNRMDFDPELLVRWIWENHGIVYIPTRVNYPTDGISHFRILEDNLLISKMHTKLFFLMLLKLPNILLRRYRMVHSH